MIISCLLRRCTSVARTLAASAAIVPLLVLALVARCGSPGTRPDTNDAPTNPALRAELIEMGRRDQQVREGLKVRSVSDTVLLRQMLQMDSALTNRLREIVRVNGWPGKSAVGHDASQAAFLIVQHSPSLDFMKQMLPLLREAARRGEAEMSDVALLSDRILTNENKPQVYGTQFQIKDGRLVPYPIDDPAHLDERRASVGLPPMTEYVAKLRETYGGPVDFDTTMVARDTART